MNENVSIINRYFAAIQQLKADKIIRGLRTITERYGLNRWNLITLRNDPDGHTTMMQPAWLASLVRDYMVSPLWLLTGDGTFYRDGWTAEDVRGKLGINKPEKMQIPRKRGRPRKHPVENQLFADGV